MSTLGGVILVRRTLENKEQRNGGGWFSRSRCLPPNSCGQSGGGAPSFADDALTLGCTYQTFFVCASGITPDWTVRTCPKLILVKFSFFPDLHPPWHIRYGYLREKKPSCELKRSTGHGENVGRSIAMHQQRVNTWAHNLGYGAHTTTDEIPRSKQQTKAAEHPRRHCSIRTALGAFNPRLLPLALADGCWMMVGRPALPCGICSASVLSFMLLCHLLYFCQAVIYPGRLRVARCLDEAGSWCAVVRRFWRIPCSGHENICARADRAILYYTPSDTSC